jgi:O-antigen ligase
MHSENPITISGFGEMATAGIAYVLFFLILLLPAASAVATVKMVLLAVLLALVVIGAVLKGKFALDSRVAMITGFFAAFGILLVLRGMILGAPGASNLAGVHAFWPVVYLILIGGMLQVSTLKSLEKTIIVASATIGTLAVAYLLSQLHIIPEIPHFEALLPDDEATIGFYEGYVRMALPGVNSLSFLVPFLMATIVIRSASDSVQPSPKVWIWISLLLSMFVVIVSGRRATTLALFLTPVLIFAFGFFAPSHERSAIMKSLRRLIVTAVLGVFLVILLLRPVYTISFEGFFDRFSSGFDFSATSVDNSPDERRQQFFALLNGWYEHPVFGAGLGEPAYGSIRSDVMPWAYELSYLALLYQTGLVGMGIYAAGIAWIYFMGIRILRSGGMFGESMLPLLVGMTCFLIANATNPYLAKFDGLWIIFFPVAVINLWLVQRDNARYVGWSNPQPVELGTG